MTDFNPRSSTLSIRRRLFILLLRAFTIVVVLIAILMLVSVVVILNRAASENSAFYSDVSPILEAYYLGHGSWEGVQTLLDHEISRMPDDLRNGWKDTIVLDQQGRILLDGSQKNSGREGSLYQSGQEEIRLPLNNQGVEIGTLVITRSPSVLELFGYLLRPLGLVSILLAILTVVIGLLLMRRVVNPLAEVISASQSVASGNLSTRVKVQGPDDLRALNESFNRMTAALEHKDRQQRDMLADIAHELRTPLSVIRGRLEGIVDGVYPLDEAHVAPLLEEAYLLERLIEDLGLLALAEARQLPFDIRPVSLAELAEHTACLFEAEAEENKITLQIETQPGLPPVSADPQRTEQVISNLVGNALRYIPAGGQVMICIRVVPGAVELTVDDNGAGLPEEHLAHIFDRFWRGERSRSRASGGAGLGLAIARQFIEIQGGKIWARNRMQGGLQVGFSLPLAAE